MNWRKIVSRATATFLLLVLLYLLFRNSILHFAIDTISKKLNKRFNLELTVGQSSFNGLTTVQMNDITIVPAAGDTLFHLDTLSATPAFGSLLVFNLKLRSLEMKSGFVHLSCNDGSCNYSSLFSPKQDTAKPKAAEKNFSALFHSFFSKAFDLAPQNAEVRNVGLSFISDTFQVDVRIPEFYSSKEKMEGELLDVKQNKSWKLIGSFDQDRRQYDVEIYPLNDDARLPLMKELFNLSCGFDSIHAALTENDFTKNNFTIGGEVSSTNFFFYQSKISDDTIKIEHLQFDYKVCITPNSVSLDSVSSFMMNKITIHPFAKVTSDKGKVYELQIKTDTVDANGFFSSLPAGMFDETRDIQADGTLQYSLNFKLDSSQPDSVEFNSQMSKLKFRVRKSGTEDLSKMNEEFLHTVYEHDRPFRSFMIGASNPDFTPTDQISANLKNAILTSEDGNFFFHNGFNEDAFRKSIAENYRKGKFVRGGSTISMQLVKNVFLSRHKTIARKAEEALIVWLIESNRLCSKERMFEVYLNIIELGPGVYGVGEASRFYFNKKPAELTLSESIFLASLLPHPKWFKYSFDEQGNLKPYLADYYRVVSNFLLRKNLISQNEYDEITPNVELKGIAREMVVPTDSIPVDDVE